MRHFTALFDALDSTTRTTEKLAALKAYFTTAEDADAVWALYFLCGEKIKRSINTRLLREWVAEEAQLPLWLFEESYDRVGDLAETIALVLPYDGDGTDLPLNRVVEDRIIPLREMEEVAKRELVVKSWGEFNARQRLVWHKLIGGGFRAGVQRKLVTRALAEMAGIETPVMEHRLAGSWEPTVEFYRGLFELTDEASVNPAQPYPFYLAYQFEDEPETLGPVEEWQIEWKWDGIRAQAIRRAGQTLLWSRGEELMTERFPELADAVSMLPDGTVLDGEILVWGTDGPRSFGDLQRRIGRKKVGKKMLADFPAAFMVYDYLEKEGNDFRSAPMVERREALEELISTVGDGVPLKLSSLVQADSWEAAKALRQESRARGVEGFMMKRRSSPYKTGRTKGGWWKWKVDPFSADCVLINAQRGHGRRASLYTDYTFGVWAGDQLVPVMKAYSGLTDAEFREVDKFIRKNTLERFGPVRSVTPELVFELHFEGIRESTRHKSGIAVRFPRMHRWRKDKKPEDADTIETLRALLNAEGVS